MAKGALRGGRRGDHGARPGSRRGHLLRGRPGGRRPGGGRPHGDRPRPAANPPPGPSVEIHGLRAADLVAAPPAAEALLPLVSALRGRVPVVHVAWVEQTFLGPGLRELGSSSRRRPWTRRCCGGFCACLAAATIRAGAPSRPWPPGSDFPHIVPRRRGRRPHHRSGLPRAGDPSRSARRRDAGPTHPRTLGAARPGAVVPGCPQPRLNAAMISRWKASTCSRMMVRAVALSRDSSASSRWAWSWTAWPSPGTRSSTRYQILSEWVK